MQTLPISEKGLQKAKEKINALKKEFELMPGIIKVAREKGDLKENAEYHAARERQGMLNGEIQHLTSQITQSQVLNTSSFPVDVVTYGKHVKLKNIASNEEKQYTLVGPAEINFWTHGISVVTSMAKALLGKKANDEVVVSAPGGDTKYKILSIHPMEQ